MKTILLSAFLLASMAMSAQTSSKSSTNVATTTKKDGQRTSHNSVSIADSNGSYALSAQFDANKMEQVKKILLKGLGSNYEKTATGLQWNSEGNKSNPNVYLTGTMVNMAFDADEYKGSDVKHFKAIGQEISDLLSNNKQ